MTMTLHRLGGLVMLFAAAVGLFVAANHPVMHGAGHGADPHGFAFQAGLVHSAAIAGQILITFGALALTLTVLEGAPLALLALTVFIFGSVATVLAATMSGYISPQYLVVARDTPPETIEIIRQIARLSMRLNQAFGFIHQIAVAAAIAIWALAWPGRTLLAAAMQVLGALAGLGSLGLLLWLVVENQRLDVHMFGIVTLAQSVWFAGAGIALLAHTPKTESA